MEYILQVNRLYKRYKDVEAFNGISFGIRPGIISIQVD